MNIVVTVLAEGQAPSPLVAASREVDPYDPVSGSYQYRLARAIVRDGYVCEVSSDGEVCSVRFLDGGFVHGLSAVAVWGHRLFPRGSDHFAVRMIVSVCSPLKPVVQFQRLPATRKT